MNGRRSYQDAGPGLETPRIDVAGACRPGRSETVLILNQRPHQAGGWPQKAQRVQGVAEVGVAPIGAADAIRRAL